VRRPARYHSATGSDILTPDIRLEGRLAVAHGKAFGVTRARGHIYLLGAFGETENIVR